ncbi:MAG TPA: rhodoquinone biosynthesis methyltransferase RquA [Steroidobacteraceae bacterium]|nr:rhodoquinone biosynthesis methyltransferase RquA [Steroidobacteraceae bacterium]
MELELQNRESQAIPIPGYLQQVYWWAYVHPRSVYLFERQWLVNLILWGNFPRLRDAALDALGVKITGRTLQVACVYGDLTSRLAARMQSDARLDVIDILTIQLDNLARKLPNHGAVRLMQGDSAVLPFESDCYDRVLLFFLLHEQPEGVRRKTLAEALRVVKPGGEIVIVDYHKPHKLHPLYFPMAAILKTLEPFALDLWRHSIIEWLPMNAKLAAIETWTMFGGLYQLLRIKK